MKWKRLAYCLSDFFCFVGRGLIIVGNLGYPPNEVCSIIYSEGTSSVWEPDLFALLSGTDFRSHIVSPTCKIGDAI